MCLASFSLLLVYYDTGYGQCGCTNFVDHDYCNVTLTDQYPDSGVANFAIYLYTTCANGEEGDDLMPEFWIDDARHDAFNYGSHGDYSTWCARVCFPCWCDEPCLGVPSHTLHHWTMPLHYSGKFS